MHAEIIDIGILLDSTSFLGYLRMLQDIAFDDVLGQKSSRSCADSKF